MDHASSQKTRLYRFVLELLRYGCTTVISLLALYGGIGVAGKAGVPSTIAYPVLLSGIYVIVYFTYARYVFDTQTNRHTLIRFLLVLSGSWLGNTLLFSLSIHVFHLPYGVALILNTILLGGIRFLLQRHFVFRKHEAVVPLDL